MIALLLVIFSTGLGTGSLYVTQRRPVKACTAVRVLYPAWKRHLPTGWRAVAEQAARFDQGLRYAPLADGPNWMIRRTGVAFNSFERIVSGLVRFPHFELRLGAHAQCLTWNSALGRVDGVAYVDLASLDDLTDEDADNVLADMKKVAS